ncbi:nuclear RNA export factor 1/2 [Trypanosoma grayi]|uniref:nuclear RNA export factor 1/2 n=1 Tax=Trypanosoma grayi TaxID=71804 RepID=UPI0004F40F81|nr:nuclear RNA export factor 1/2 [Trypanosoma grayi]KEG11888.1 nuclear RNA export factor 1/2 [Trypanosoma grayi]
MSRPYSKHRGRGGGGSGRGNFGRGHASQSDNAPSGRGGRWNGRGGWQGGKNNHNNNNHNNNSNNNDKNSGGVGGGGGAAASVMTTLLDLLFQKSSGTIFCPANGMLDLSNFHDSPDLASVQRSVDFSSVAFCKSLADVVKNRIGTSLRILVLNNNNIRKLSSFLTALEEADVHHGVTTISATGNPISDLTFLGPLKKYGSLVELLLEGDPVTTRNDYRAQVTKSLPKLMMLDRVLIDRALLRLPNPLPANLHEAQISVLQFLEASMFAAAAAGNYDAMVNMYTPAAVFSVSRAEEPIPRRLPLDATHNCQMLSAPQRNIINNDFAILRKHIQWRNIFSDVHSLRNISTGRAKASLALQSIGGGSKKFISISHELNGNANVAFLSHNMKVPTCVLTVHGRLFWHWAPKNSDGSNVLPENVTPFFSCFFDRTMTLLLDNATSTWSIQNDMIFLRPDRTVVHENGTPSSPLFFANDSTRVEAMRRRYLPKATPEVMQTIIEHLGSDADLQAFATEHLTNLPQERVMQALEDRAAMLELLRG